MEEEEGKSDREIGQSPQEDVGGTLSSIERAKPNTISSVFMTSGQYRMDEILMSQGEYLETGPLKIKPSLENTMKSKGSGLQRIDSESVVESLSDSNI